MGIPREKAGCASVSCLQRAMRALGVERLAAMKIVTVGKSYKIEVALYKGTRLLGKSSQRCDICTTFEALQTTIRTAAEIGSQPELSETASGGTSPALSGTSPSAEGTGSGSQPSSAGSAGASKPIAIEKASGRRSWPLWPAITAGSAGILSLAIGIPLIAMDGAGTSCIGDARDDKRNCAELYNTAAGGGVMTTLGIVGLGASTVFFLLHYSTKDRQAESRKAEKVGLSHVSVGPTRGGGMTFGAFGRF